MNARNNCSFLYIFQHFFLIIFCKFFGFFARLFAFFWILGFRSDWIPTRTRPDISPTLARARPEHRTIVRFFCAQQGLQDLKRTIIRFFFRPAQPASPNYEQKKTPAGAGVFIKFLFGFRLRYFLLLMH